MKQMIKLESRPLTDREIDYRVTEQGDVDASRPYDADAEVLRKIAGAA